LLLYQLGGHVHEDHNPKYIAVPMLLQMPVWQQTLVELDMLAQRQMLV
jgi:hypothetical protein